MKVVDILNSLWAIQPEMYQTILGVYDRWMQGETPNFPALEAALGRPLHTEVKKYEVTDGVAVIQVDGVLAKRMNMMMEISGGTSTDLLSADFREALGRADVKAILLDINSPGGTVDGTIELAKEIYNARGTKPVFALGDGVMASAAMWIAAAADEVWLSGEATMAGSIGIITTHVDMSRAEDARGLKTTVLTAGKYKAIANQYEPLGQEGRQSIQDRLDYVYSLFIQDMATFLGSDVETVVEKMADGRLFLGRQAVDAGLADGIMSREQVIKRLTGKTGRAITSGAGARNTGGGKMEGLTMAMLRADHADLVAVVLEEGRAAGLVAGAEAERARILAVEAQALPGHEALIARLKADGKTSGPEAAVQVLQAEKANNGKLLGTLETEAVQPVRPSVEKPGAGLAGEAKWQAEYDASAELQAEFGSFGAYKGFKAATEAGMVKVVSNK